MKLTFDKLTKLEKINYLTRYIKSHSLYEDFISKLEGNDIPLQGLILHIIEPYSLNTIIGKINYYNGPEDDLILDIFPDRQPRRVIDSYNNDAILFYRINSLDLGEWVISNSIHDRVGGRILYKRKDLNGYTIIGWYEDQTSFLK